MHPRRTGFFVATSLRLLLAGLPAPALHGQAVTTGTISVAAGGTLLDGDLPAFQQRLRQHKDGYGGVENYSLTRTDDNGFFRVDAKFMPGDEDYRLAARWEKFDAFYVQANYRQFRIFYDGSGGRLLPRNLAISYFDEDLAIDRSYFSLELGNLGRDRPLFVLRYDHNTRDGTKNSLRWGDSNLAGAPYSPRAFIPSYYVVDEQRDILTFTASNRTETSNWKLSARHERAHTANHHVARRRALEPQDRYVTMVDASTTDLFSGHGFYERTFNESLRASAGGLVTTIDGNVTGSKIYGDTPDAAYSASFARRQSGDVGYYGLVGQTRLKQYLANANVTYQPAKLWIIRPGVKFEHLRVEAGEDHTDTNLSGGLPVENQIEAANRKAWSEFTEDVEVRYLRWTNLSLSARAILNQGTGHLVEQSILYVSRAPVIDRDTNYDRYGQRYTFDATWYARPGLTFGAQLNYRLKLADYRSSRDSTSNSTTSKDRYPAYIIDQDIASRDAVLRASWRPRSNLTFVTRYAYQQALTTSTMDNLPAIQNGRLVRHVVTQTATWNATQRLYLTAAFNVTFDQLSVPPNRFTMNGDNNYTTASLGAGYALGKKTDVYFDGSYFRADNYSDNVLSTLPLNSGHLLQSAFLTWVRRQNERLIYTVRYGVASNRDGTFGGLNDFTAQMIYGRVQYKF